MAKAGVKANSGVTQKDMVKKAKMLCEQMLSDLENSKRPVLESI